MQRRYRPAYLTENIYGTSYPSPTIRCIDISSLNGGLNLWDLDYRLEANQSPDLVNVYWQDGSLSSRPGQAYVYESAADDEHKYGAFCACYERPWQNYIIAHKGSMLYKIDPSTGEHTRIYDGELSTSPGGNFFVFGNKLYYLSGHGDYVVIDQTCRASDVSPYIPIVIVNRKPDGTGGDTFQDENRLSPQKKIQFTTDGTSTEYHVPSGYTPMDAMGVIAELTSPSAITYKELQVYTNYAGFPTKGEANIYYYDSETKKYYTWSLNAYNEETTAPDLTKTFGVNRTTGVITFNKAPAAAMTQSPSNLEITVSKADEDTLNSILNCSCATVYGGDTQLAVVCGGTPKQPNAYFWSGSTQNGTDPTYFPFDYYNYAGASADEYVTGFGKQQSMLVIFKERSIGRSYFSTVTIDDMDYLKLPFTPINESIGCNLSGSIRLIENNLVFANTYGGVYVLLDTSSYGENIVKRISRNINGDGITAKGMLYDTRQVASTAVTSFDDGQRYWLIVDGYGAYLWDYALSSYSRNEENISWFYFNNINARGWFKTVDTNIYFTRNGSIAKFIEQFNDFGEAIERRYTFATQNFGTYEVLKDVIRVIFSVRSDTDSAMRIVYKTDYEIREDKTPIRAYGYRLSPRDLTHRSLRPIMFAGTAVRQPRCYHVRHFAMTLINNAINTDMSVVSAQILYRYNREDR